MATVGMFDFGGLIAQLSPLMAWAMIKYTGNWRNVYYLMLGCAIFNLVYLYFFYHPPAFATKHSTDGRTRWDLFKSFDWLGLFIFVSGCTLFLVGVNWGGVLYPWVSAPVIAPIVIGAVLLIGLGFYEAYANIPEPLLPPRLFKQVRQSVTARPPPCHTLSVYLTMAMQVHSTYDCHVRSRHAILFKRSALASIITAPFRYR